MPPRLLLDGEDLRGLMLRVRDEMGPTARIVKAERVRTGGVGGFFAKEHYELTIEVPDQPSPTTRPGTRTAPGPATGPETARSAVGMEALLAAADAAERGEGPLRTDGPTASSPPSRDAPPTVSTAGDTFAAVLDSMRQMVGEDRTPGTPPDAPPSGAEVPGAAPAGSRPADPATSASDVPTLEPGRSVVPPPDPRPEPDPDRPGSTAQALLELGIPAHMMIGVMDPTAPLALSVLVRRFGHAPTAKLTKGNVVAVVGAAPAALRTATQMAHRAGLEARDILLAGDTAAVPRHGRRLQTPAALARYRSRVSPDALYVVVIGVGEDREDWAKAAPLVAALQPTQVWGVVDARRKAVELRRWTRVVGSERSIDALAVHSTFDAQAPGTVLNLGVPVGWVDGLPASPLVWAAVLSERLADDARWE